MEGQKRLLPHVRVRQQLHQVSAIYKIPPKNNEKKREANNKLIIHKRVLIVVMKTNSKKTLTDLRLALKTKKGLMTQYQSLLL